MKLFVSYSHDSDAHREQVLGLSERLRADGIETMLDRYVNGAPPGGWPRWMLDQLDTADAVLVVCSETCNAFSRKGYVARAIADYKTVLRLPARSDPHETARQRLLELGVRPPKRSREPA
jgi:hypothetical protein